MDKYEIKLHRILIEKNITKQIIRPRSCSWDKSNIFSKEVRSQAEIHYPTVQQKALKDELESKIKIYETDNILFSQCKTMNGISKEMFLKRFLAFRPLSNFHKLNCQNMLTHHCNNLHPEKVLGASLSDSLESLDTICCIATSLEWSSQINDWMLKNSQVLWSNLADLLLLKDHDIVSDVCIAIAFLMNKLPNQVTKFITKILDNLVLLMRNCCIEFDSYLSDSRQLSENAQYEIENQKFFAPQLDLKRTDFFLLSLSFYSQVFAINFNFNQDIISHIVDLYIEMTEMGRNIYLDLIKVIIEKLKKNIENSKNRITWIHTAEKLLEKLSIVPLEKNMCTREQFTNIFLVLRNLVNSKAPNYICKIRKKASEYEDKLILSRTKIDEIDRIPRYSLIGNLLLDGISQNFCNIDEKNF